MSNATSYTYGKPQGNKTNFSIEDKKPDKKETEFYKGYKNPGYFKENKHGK
jgi:hypothetical protein